MEIPRGRGGMGGCACAHGDTASPPSAIAIDVRDALAVMRAEFTGLTQ